jgi:chitin disaccharide deacetylase
MNNKKGQSGKCLIISADDMGASACINDAIIKLFKASAITGTSLVANGPAFAEACRMLRDNGINEAGAHLTLTENYPPVNPDTYKIKGFLNKKGYFPGGYINLALKLYSGKIKKQVLYDELRLQVEKIRQEGFVLTHIDSHEYVHMLPLLWQITLKLCEEFSIPYIRIPNEGLGVAGKDFQLRDIVRSRALWFFSKNAHKKIKDAGLVSGNAFLGHFHSGRLDSDILSFMAEHIQEGITELVVHPAFYSEDFLKDFPFYRNSPNEIKALMSGEWKEKLKSLGITLISHSDANVIARHENSHHCERHEPLCHCEACAAGRGNPKPK